MPEEALTEFVQAITALPEEEQKEICLSLYYIGRDDPDWKYEPAIKRIPARCQELGIPLRPKSYEIVTKQLFTICYPKKAFYAVDVLVRSQLPEYGRYIYYLRTLDVPEDLKVHLWYITAVRPRIPYKPNLEIRYEDLIIAYDKPAARKLGLLPPNPKDDPPRRKNFPWLPMEIPDPEPVPEEPKTEEPKAEEARGEEATVQEAG